MSDLKVEGKIVQLDDEGFLVNQDDWNHAVAREIAKKTCMYKLDDDQIEIIVFLRKYYKKFNAFPILNYV